MDVYQHICPVRLSDRHGEPLNPLKDPLLPRTLDCFGRFSSKAAFPKTVCPCYRCRCGLGRMRLFFSPYPLHWTADTRTYVPAICDLCPMKGIRFRKPKTWCDFVLQVRTIDSLRGPLAAFFWQVLPRGGSGHSLYVPGRGAIHPIWLENLLIASNWPYKFQRRIQLTF